jgi:hypothetical protein
MLKPSLTELAFERFAKAVVRKAKGNLTRDGHKNTGALYRSLDNWELKVSKQGSVSLTFSYEDYGEFQDKGVKGAANFKSHKMTEATPYRFRDKMPPKKPIEAFIKAKGIDVNAFVIQRSIFQKGIPQTLFFTKPFRDSFKALPENILDAFGGDVDNFLKNIK